MQRRRVARKHMPERERGDAVPQRVHDLVVAQDIEAVAVARHEGDQVVGIEDIPACHDPAARQVHEPCERQEAEHVVRQAEPLRQSHDEREYRDDDDHIRDELLVARNEEPHAEPGDIERGEREYRDARPIVPERNIHGADARI